MSKVTGRVVIACVWAVLFVLSIAAPPPASGAGLAQQRVSLSPGWNAVYLEVGPEPADPASVFGDLKVASVWTWIPLGEAVQFVRNPGDAAPGVEGWHVWFPPSSGKKAALTNLFTILPNRPYLVEFAGAGPAELLVEGSPALARPKWVANSFNFTGFPVDPDAPPTFDALFAGSPAHRGQPLYRLGADGTWQLLADAPSARVRPGEAFWVFCEGPSEWSGPLRVRLDYGETLDFGASIPERRLTLENQSGSARSVTISSGTGVPLAQRMLQPTGLQAWPALAPQTSLALAPAGKDQLRLAVRRAEIGTEGASSILEIRDGAGLLLRVPVLAAPLGAAGAMAGLWVGTVRADRVTEAQIPSREAFTTPQPAAFEFSFKIILHVDDAGRARLLKEAIQVWDATGGGWVIAAGEEIAAPYLATGSGDARRLSTAAYDFSGWSVDCGNGFGPGGMLACAVTVPPALPTNPFRHEYHPDHDNLDALGYPIGNEAITEVYRVSRALSLSFDTTSPECAGDAACTDPPDWGHTRVAGAYAETLTGLHRNPIKVAGRFALQRVTDVANLVTEVAP